MKKAQEKKLEALQSWISDPGILRWVRSALAGYKEDDEIEKFFKEVVPQLEALKKQMDVIAKQVNKIFK